MGSRLPPAFAGEPGNDFHKKLINTFLKSTTKTRNQKRKTMKVAFQGEIGAFSEEAVWALYGEAEVVPSPSMEAVFEAVEAGRVERGGGAHRELALR